MRHIPGFVTMAGDAGARPAVDDRDLSPPRSSNSY
jgi:hypothetical protein